MGYTHYYTHRRRFTNTEWRDEICPNIAKIILASGVPIEDDPFDLKQIMINGVEEDGHETFCLSQEKAGWDFCKTARKPYDVIVTAVLCYLESCYQQNFSVGSDGDSSDWADGLALAIRALPEKGNILNIPYEVRWESQWLGGVHGKNYAVRQHVSGHLCVIKGYEVLGHFPEHSNDSVLKVLDQRPRSGVLGEIEKKTDRIIRNLITYPEMVDGEP